MTELGEFDDLVGIAAPELHGLLRRLRAQILKLDPAVCEVVRLGDRAATYGLGPKKMSEGYAYLMPQSAWVNLGFYQGAGLPDPGGLLEGTGAKLRHVKVRSMAEADRPAIRALLRAARRERRAALGR